MSPSAPAPAGQYSVPSNGVITSWSYQAGTIVPPQTRLKALRGTLPNLTGVGESNNEVLVANQVNTFPTRVAVQAGDLIGVSVNDSFSCAAVTPGATFQFFNGPDIGTGSPRAFAPGGALAIPLSAQLEPDADNDGFGDETQDGCPTDATKRADCVPPETTMTKKPKKKDKKKKASFEFTSSEAGSSFRCSLNGSAFESCTSPRSVKAKKGLNVFTVFARDAAGNVDESPATYSWTYKKPKKK